MAKKNKAKKKEEGFRELVDDFLVYARSYIFPFVAVVALALMAYFVYVPYLEMIPELLQKNKTLGENIQTLDANKERLEELNNLSLDSMSSALDSSIPTEPKVASLVEVVVTRAQDSGLEVAVPTEAVADSETEEEEESLIIQYLTEQQEAEAEAEVETETEEETASQGLEEVSAGERESYEEELGVIPVPVEITLVGTRSELEDFFASIDQQERKITVRQVSIDVRGGNWEADVMVYGYVGTVSESSLVSYERITADSDLVFSKINEINIDLDQNRFNEVTSRLD